MQAKRGVTSRETQLNNPLCCTAVPRFRFAPIAADTDFNTLSGFARRHGDRRRLRVVEIDGGKRAAPHATGIECKQTGFAI